jgi:C1A family cysteine protease
MLDKLLLWCYKIISKFYVRPICPLGISICFDKTCELSDFALGALKDKKDDRDYSVGVIGDIDVPAEIDMREFVPEVKSQGKLSSCVAHAICSAIEMQINMQDPRRYVPLSELYNYYHGRWESNIFPADGGMYPRDAIKSVKDEGIALEVAHPYNVEFYNRPPSSAAESVAHIYSAMTKEYFRVFSDVAMMEKLALGLPIMINVPVYNYWFLPKIIQNNTYITNPTGKIRKPTDLEPRLGYHALLVVGYDEDGWICLNSWGKNYGDKGFCYLPYGYEIIDRWVLVVE